MVDGEIVEIIWCSGTRTQLHDQLEELLPLPVRLFEGMPDIDDISSLNSKGKIVVLEDLQSETDENMQNLYSRGSHHRNLSVLRTVQNLFHRGKGNRDITLNSHYLVLFNNPRDRSQISSFARQVDPQNSKFVIEAFNDATKNPHTYLLFDFSQATDNDLRLRSTIFPGEDNVIYVAKKKKYK
jgi:hypothetical protein